MDNKDKNLEYLDNVDYKDVLKEEIRNFLEADSLNDENFSNKVNKYNKFKRTPLEIINRLLFFLFIGSFLSSFASVYMESKTWFIFYVIWVLKQLLRN